MQQVYQQLNSIVFGALIKGEKKENKSTCFYLN